MRTSTIFIFLLMVFQLEANSITLDTLPAQYQNIPTKVDQPAIFKSDSCIGLEGNQLESCSKKEMFDFIDKHLKFPVPSPDRCGCVEGLSVATVIIDIDGKVRDAIVLRSIGGGTDEEALKVVRLLEFTPAKHRRKPTEVRLNIPIRFRLKQN